ncbi:MAG: hypothetical protein NTW49_07860 [Bacteroidia bacterium]|nr:hypothetical protein [Bacteroidia bacterium]
MNNTRLIILFSFLSTTWIISSCSGGQKQSDRVKTKFVAGKVIEKVICKQNTSQSYALYLPVNYNESKTYPVIYFFDSHAQGKVPLTRYHKLADKYGFILAGSNNSENGKSPDEAVFIAKVLAGDVTAKVPVNEKRVYTCGFSGGARVAGWAAMVNGGVAGVIACAAGISRANEQSNADFDFIGLVGDEDFNYLELKNLDMQLENSPIKHQLTVFQGKHEWPSAEIMEEAFWWCETTAMNKNLIPKNDSLLTKISVAFNQQLSSCGNTGDQGKAALVLKKLIHYFDGLLDVNSYKTKLEQIEKSGEYMKQIKSEQELDKMETSKQDEFMKSFAARPSAWWNKEVNDLNAQIKSKSDRQRKMAMRLKNYISLGSFMNASGALNKNDFAATLHYLQLYESVDENNPDLYYLYACYFAKQNKPDEAIQSFEKSVNLGFSDRQKASADPSLQAIQNSDAFGKLLDRINRH